MYCFMIILGFFLPFSHPNKIEGNETENSSAGSQIKNYSDIRLSNSSQTQNAFIEWLPESQSIDYLVYAGQIQTHCVMDWNRNFTSFIFSNKVKIDSWNWMIGLKTWYFDYNYWFTDIQFLVPVEVGHVNNFPTGYLGGYSLVIGISPYEMKAVRPYAYSGYSSLKLTEYQFSFRGGKKYDSADHAIIGLGFDFIIEQVGFGVDYKHSLFSSNNDKNYNQLLFKLGFVL